MARRGIAGLVSLLGACGADIPAIEGVDDVTSQAEADTSNSPEFDTTHTAEFDTETGPEFDTETGAEFDTEIQGEADGRTGEVDGGADVGAPTGGWLLAFHTCDPSNCGSPGQHRVQLAASPDGMAWALVPGWQDYAGSVPDVHRRGDTAYVMRAGGFLRRFDLATHTFAPEVQVTVDGQRPSFVDPSWALDDSGRFVLFYLEGMMGQDPARCRPEEDSCTKTILSATEVVGSDGTAYTRDPGARLEVTIRGNQSASDPDIFFDGQRWNLYLSMGGITHFAADDLRGAYLRSTALPNGVLTGGATVPCGEWTGSEYWTLGHRNENGLNVIKRARHATLDRPLMDSDFTPLFEPEALGLGRVHVESPGLTPNR